MVGMADSILVLPPGPKCAIYTRQSRTRPEVVLSSCEVQRGIGTDFAHEHGLTLADETFDDAGESSESLDRPALKRLLHKIERGEIDHVVVYCIDRLTRKLRDLSKLLDLFQKYGVKLSVVTDPHFGESAAHRLTFNIVAAASEFQLEMTRERMADSRAALKRQGRRVAGRVPFGYRTDDATKQLVVHPAEAAVMRRLFELASSGSRPQAIADQFNFEKVVGARGQMGGWTARQILKLLSNQTYTGTIHDGTGILPGRHEAFVTPAVFEQVRQSIESRRSRAPGRSEPKVNWPLRGLLVCGECGRVMSPSISGYKSFRYRYYRCRSRAFGRPPCKNVGFSAYELEEFVRTNLSSESWQLADHVTTAESQEFAAAWRRLDERQQRTALAAVLKEVRFHPQDGMISMTLVEGALNNLREK